MTDAELIIALAKHRERLEADNIRLRKTLEPFAVEGRGWSSPSLKLDDHPECIDSAGCITSMFFTVGDLLRAYVLIERPKKP